MTAHAESWNKTMAASPGPLDLQVSAEDVHGSIPQALRGGRMLSNGPGWTHIGGHLAHPFDGHGYVRSFRFTPDGGVHLQAAFVQTPSYRAEVEAGGFRHRGLGTNKPGGMLANLIPGPVRNVANTTIMRRGNRLLAGWEAGSPHALHPDSLATLGPDTFGGLIDGQATLAHMRRDATRDRLTMCSVKQGRDTTFTFRELDAHDTLVQEQAAVVPGAVFTHDYSLSPSWYVLGGNPLRFRPMALAGALLGAGTLMNAITPDARKPGQLHLVPRAGGPVRTVPLPGPAFVVHFGNAFERNGDVVIDACAFSEFEFGAEFGYQGPSAPFDPGLPEARGPQQLLRITIPAGANVARWEPLTAHGVDFPRFHPHHEGRETRWLFGATRADTRFSDPFDSLIALDLQDGARSEQLWTAPEGVFVGEPVPVPDGDRVGHVLCLLSDGLNGRTTLAVFEAERVAAGPVAKVDLPLLPIAFHGDWDGGADGAGG